MANHRSALKRIRSSERKRQRNRIVRGRARTFVKKAKLYIAAGNTAEAEAAVIAAISALDKAAEKGVIHKNNAARRKSRLMRALNKAKAAA
ncbi:MAG: 30S ribosomal protein S20 [Caldilineales bacterium]|nr:30S ribosomal protein S20 [Caldilineales bacterium]MDW8316633.1 30S ribosomal protein S20 [Anaerolineae bacterium]